MASERPEVVTHLIRTTQTEQPVLGNSRVNENSQWFSGFLEVRERHSDAEGRECKHGVCRLEKRHLGEPLLEGPKLLSKGMQTLETPRTQNHMGLPSPSAGSLTVTWEEAVAFGTLVLHLLESSWYIMMVRLR